MSVKIGLASKIVLIAMLVVSIVGCEKDESSEGGTLSSDARVLSFVLTDNAAVAPSLASYVFSIDQKTSPSVIENNDSLPVGTNVNRNLLATIVFNGASDAKVVYRDGSREAKSYASTDSINFANNNIQIEVSAANGSTKKIYQVKVNVHKEDPDALSWHLESSTTKSKEQAAFYEGGSVAQLVAFFREGDTLTKYYISSGKTESINKKAVISSISYIEDLKQYVFHDEDRKLYMTGGSYGEDVVDMGIVVDKLFGFVMDWDWEEEPKKALYLIYSKEGKLYAFNPERKTSLDIDFPKDGRLELVDSFVRVSNVEGAFYNHLIVVGRVPGEEYSQVYEMYVFNEELVCSSYLNQSNQRRLPSLVGSALFEYSGALFSIGGEKADGLFTKEVYISRDYGVNWEKQTKKLSMSGVEEFTPRRGVSVAVKNDKYVYLIGGETTPMTFTSQIWRGKLNKIDHQYQFPAK